MKPYLALLCLLPSTLFAQHGRRQLPPDRPPMVCMVPPRPTRIEMAPLREPLTPRQLEQLRALRNEYLQKRNTILHSPQ